MVAFIVSYGQSSNNVHLLVSEMRTNKGWTNMAHALIRIKIIFPPLFTTTHSMNELFISSKQSDGETTRNPPLEVVFVLHGTCPSHSDHSFLVVILLLLRVDIINGLLHWTAWDFFRRWKMMGSTTLHWGLGSQAAPCLSFSYMLSTILRSCIGALIIARTAVLWMHLAIM